MTSSVPDGNGKHSNCYHEPDEDEDAVECHHQISEWGRLSSPHKGLITPHSEVIWSCENEKKKKKNDKLDHDDVELVKTLSDEFFQQVI